MKINHLKGKESSHNHQNRKLENRSRNNKMGVKS